ncbi:MAG TPA: hypothetical protein VG708_06495 [Mycobacteriales bacterium]|nr:hypothetical protein [Mycobacteriales bacterium]
MASPVGRLPASARRLVDDLVDRVVDLAPHVPARDLATLRAHHPDLRAPDALAHKLVETAARATGAVGAAGGVVSSFELAAPPLLLSAPVQIVAETSAVVAIELKLVAELHEVYGRPAVGTPAVRAAAYLGAWTRRRALDTLNPTSGWGGVLSGAARRQLRQRLVRRAGSNAASIVPFLAGAVAGASLNSRETRRLGQQLIRDLAH